MGEVDDANSSGIHVLMRDEKKGRKKQANIKAKQHSTPKAVTCTSFTYSRATLHYSLLVSLFFIFLNK